jgi:two-component system, sensor histidine kinase and response regulator
MGDAERTQRLKIGVVDDEPAVCSLIEDILEQAGYIPVATTESRAALELVRRENPALLLVDITMPGMDGYQLLAALQADPQTKSCPVVFVTAQFGFLQRMHAFEEGVRGYITKPFLPTKLAAMVDKILGERRPAPPLN